MGNAPPSALEFLVRRLLDREEGGVHRAVDAAGQRLLRRDKHIADQVSAVRVLANHGHTADLRVALDGLLSMQDQQGNAGFVELTDRNWRPLPSGQVRTLCHQLDAAAALLAAAVRLELDDVRVLALDLINRCLATGPDGMLPTRVAPDWTSVLAGDCSVNTATAAAGALSVARTVEPYSADPGVLGAIADRLTRPMGPGEGYLEPSGVSRCGLAGRCALALSRASRALERDDYRKVAGAILDQAMERYYDPVDGGFWDRPVPVLDGSGGTTPPVGNGQPPRPVKRTSDAGLLLFAAGELGAAGVDTALMAERARTAIAAATDRSAGGVFLGIGYDWESAVEPTVMSFRQTWARQQHDELPATGDLDHLDLLQKTAYTHARVAAAQAADHTDGDGDGGARGRPPRPHVIRPGPGWTGVAAEPHDREVTTVYHTVAALRRLGGIDDRHTRLLDWVRFAQNPDGGFGEAPGRVSGVTSTQRAVLVLHMGGQRPSAADRCAGYLLGCADADGAFADAPGLRGDLSHTGLAVAALSALSALDPGAPPLTRTARYLRRALDPATAGTGGGPAGRSRRWSAVAVRRAVSALLLLSAPVPDPDALIAWLRDCRRPEGGFASRPGGTATIVSTGHAVAALGLLSAHPDATGDCRAWLAARTGGRDDAVTYCAPWSPAEENLALAQAEFVLAAHYDPTWLARVSWHRPAPNPHQSEPYPRRTRAPDRPGHRPLHRAAGRVVVGRTARAAATRLGRAPVAAPRPRAARRVAAADGHRRDPGRAPGAGPRGARRGAGAAARRLRRELLRVRAQPYPPETGDDRPAGRPPDRPHRRRRHPARAARRAVRQTTVAAHRAVR